MYFIARGKARGCLEELTATKERGQRRGSLRRGSRSFSRMSGIGSAGYRALLRWEIINTPDGVICQGGDTVSRERRGRLKPNKSHWDRARGALILQQLVERRARFIYLHLFRSRSLAFSNGRCISYFSYTTRRDSRYSRLYCRLE